MTVNGTLYKKSFTAPTARQAQADALAWQTESKDKRNPTNATLYDAVNSYIDINRNVFSPATIRGYMTILRNHLGDIGNLKVSAITTNILQEKVNSLSKTKSPKTVKNVFYLIIPAIHHVDKHKTFDDINLPGEGRLKPKPFVKKALQHSEAKEIFNKLNGNSIEVPVLLAAWLGLRRSEVLALTWDDVDFDNKILYINKAYVPDEYNKFVIKGVKAGESREVSIPVYILDKLKGMEQGKGRIFSDIPPSRLSEGFPKLCESILGKPYNFHDLRKTMATYGLALGIDQAIIMSIGGWKSPQTLRKFYQVILDEDRNQAQDKINDVFNSMI